MARWWWILLPAGLVGCGLFGNPGELVGHFSVEATLRENTCGAAVGSIPSSSDLSVDIYVGNGTLTWSGSQGSFQASLDDDGNFVYQVSSQVLLRQEEPDGEGGIRAACVVSQAEEVRGKLEWTPPADADAGAEAQADAGADGEDGDAGEASTPEPASVTATDTLQVAPVAGADCSDLVGSGGTLFSSLPCRVVLDLEGMAGD